MTRPLAPTSCNAALAVRSRARRIDDAAKMTATRMPMPSKMVT
jgi:hypothetical protein